MEEKSNGRNSVLTIILIAIIITLLVYIAYLGNLNTSKNSSIGNQGLLVLDNVTFPAYGNDERLVLKVKNTSSKTFNNVTPVLIYYDANNMPIHEGWGARIGYFAPNEIRCIEFYDNIKDYAKVEIGLFDREEEVTYTDLRDKITYKVQKSEELDEDGIMRLTFTIENKSNIDISPVFQISYYSDNKLIYEDEFIDIINANSTLETYEAYASEFENGNAFPEGYTYEVTLVEAVEYIDDSVDMEENAETDIEELNDDENVE